MSRSKFTHWLVGSSTDVLKEDFISACLSAEEIDFKSWLPFSGKLQLPTKLEVLKLCLFIKDVVGKKNSHVNPGSINYTVADIIKKYWDMAGFETRDRINREVKSVLDEYQGLLKSKSRMTEKCVKARENFLKTEDGNWQLFDISHSDLEKKLQKDRIRNNLGILSEDLEFLKDQRTARKAHMTNLDAEYGQKKEAQMKRRMGPAPATVTSNSSQSSEAASLSDDETSSPEDEDDAEMNKRPKRPKLIDVQLPRNILSSPLVAGAMDRTNTTPGQAMHLISAVLKSVQKDGVGLDLSEVTLSESSIRRGREKAREEICKHQFQEFQDNMPEFLAVHWDGKMMRDMSDVLNEMEAILVSGAPGYNEGKLLGRNIK